MLNEIAWFSLVLAVASAIVIAVDVVRNPQKMWIMNVVWPVTALYFSVFTVWAYFAAGRPKKKRPDEKGKSIGWKEVALSASHCGAGCTLADILTEFAIFAVGATVLGSELWASFTYDFIAAWTLGILFQYFTIKPMRNLSPIDGLKAAIKADTLSILSFQVGMYGLMAFVYFQLFAHPHLNPTQAIYWFMMQIAMVVGFLTSCPMNWFLLRRGWKERMA